MVRLQVQELAKAMGLNMSQLQLKSGLSMGLIRRYWYNQAFNEGTLKDVNLRALGKLAKVLNVSPGELLIETGEEEE